MKFIELLGKIFGNKATRDLKAIQPLVDQVLEIYPQIQALSHDELRAKTEEIKNQVQHSADDLREQIASLTAEIQETEI